MNEKALYKLEFNKIRTKLANYAITEEAREHINELRPTATPAEVYQLQEQTHDAVNISLKKGRPPINRIKQIKTSIQRVQIGGVIGSGEILNIGKVLKTSRLLKKYSSEETTGITFNSLQRHFDSLCTYKELEYEIERCIIAEDEFSDEATPTLSNIRRQMTRLTIKVKDTIQNIIQSSQYKDMLQESIVTVRDGRQCIPIKAAQKTAFKGIVHDTSGSGATVFIEPAAVVEMNNKIRELMSAEQDEIQVILATFSEKISFITEELLLTFKSIIELDIIFAKSEYALKINARAPVLNEKGYINLKGARHPLLNSTAVVPIDIYVGKEFTTLLITGPNTGGKTVTLKTIGLFTIMAQCGLFIPAKENSELAIFDDVFAGLGDEQSIEQSLSTFSAHMMNLIEILADMTTNSLILLDELGSGTDPVEGAALAMSILEHLRKQQITTVATTHYSELKLYALSTPNVENAGCEFDIQELRPTYKLLIGVPGKSNAFEISKKLGFPEHLIDDAKVFLQKENVKMEDILVELEYSKRTALVEKENALKFRQEAETLKESIKKERQKLEVSRQKILKRAEEKGKELLREVEIETENILKEVRQMARESLINVDENTLQSIKQKVQNTKITKSSEIDKKIGYTKPKPKVLKDVKVGEEVLVISFNQSGIVTNVSNNEATVQLGILPITVRLDDISRNVQGTNKSKNLTTNQNISHNVRKTMTIRPEIDLRGMTGDEAIEAASQYLDDAYLSGLKNVTIIHGKGTGVLREAIKNMLRKIPHVQSYRPGKYGEGEHGVTVVELK
ncbi:endonuclease MutS2 [Candidatus Epulonipiscium viviparus]|uniref:endonuclease MutS2 n=1 Tax=Candidatus Epulonipiscium viviparus TaxID=420336 RepID=UPI0027380623|nr:endonuclease MutS2 [Candidatus Epulopiscium viviparus]